MSTIQIDTNIQKELLGFISTAMGDIIEYHKLSPETLNDCPSFIFAPDDHYDEEIHKIDPIAEYTDDGKNKGMGKTLFKDGKCFVIINSQILTVLIQSDYKNSLSKYLIYHEIGHYINNMLNQKLRPPPKPHGEVSLRAVAEFTYSVIIDEYMANNYVTFLLSTDECVEILSTNSLYDDIGNLYKDINDQYDLFTRFWNNPKSIFRNLIENIPLFQKRGELNETGILETIDVKKIIAMLDEPEQKFDNLYKHLVDTFNVIVADYNGHNPAIYQKSIR